MSFWRYKLLEFLVAFATFPLFVLCGFLWFALWLQVIDIEQNRWLFFVVALPFLIGWFFLTNRLTRKAEKRWMARHPKKEAAACSPKS